MIRILKYLKPYKWSVVMILVLVVIRGVLELALPTLMSGILADGLNIGSQNPIVSFDMIWYYSALMLASIVVIIIVTIVSRYFESKVSAGFSKELRKTVYEKIESFSKEEMDEFTVSSLITRTTNDIQQLQGYINILLGWMFLQPILAIGAIIQAVRLNLSIAFILIASLISLVIIITVVFLIIVPQFMKMQKMVDKMNLVTRENLTGLRVVRAHNTQKYQELKIDEVNTDNKRLNIFVGRVNAILWPSIALLTGLTSVGIIYFSGRGLALDSFANYDVSKMIAMQQYSSRAIMSLMFVSMIFIMVPRARVSADRILAVLDLEPKIKESSNPVFINKEDIKGEVRFEDVSFIFTGAEQPVLSNINFTAKAGQTTAFIGSTGSGKSTLINLIPKFFVPTTGNIYIDDNDINDLSFESLYSLIGYVPQQGVLFSGTIADNIAFGKGSSLETIEESAKIAQASNFIESFDKQYDSEIAQGGTNVSGGQRQRLSIARAINKQPKIFIFDDSFSALDYQTDKVLRKALEDVSATKLIVAQRINTIINADQIIVLNNGEIVGIGTHKELLKNSSVYQEIAYSQLSEEELNNE
ncbi:MAG TPA: ABC transporter ATP-binding protein [Haploplasma sp.]|nr:ABC transporter ATP-binding protein [Haploplasma sp.]